MKNKIKKEEAVITDEGPSKIKEVVKEWWPIWVMVSLVLIGPVLLIYYGIL